MFLFRFCFADPCFHKKDGDYVLSGEWKDFFSYADPECAFIKCSNYRSFLNECSHGTKNDAQGKGYCYFQVSSQLWVTHTNRFPNIYLKI